MPSFLRWIPVLIVALMVSQLACSKPSTNQEQSKEENKQLVIGTEKAATTLDPRMAIDTYSVRATRLIFSGLFAIAEDLQPIPNLVEKFALSEDGKVYDFDLHADVLFHDGTALAPEDIISTYEFILDAKNKSFYRNAFTKVATMEKTGPTSLRITLKEPYNPFLTALTVGVVPKRFKSEPFQPVGSGPYRVKENLGAEGLILERFDDYFATPAKIAEIRLKPILDDSVRTLELLKGSVDLLQNSVPPTLMERLENKDDVVLQTSPGLAYAYLAFNLKDDVLKKKKVREAIAHAINRDEIIQYKLDKIGSPATTLLAPSHFMHASGLPVYAFDPDKAKKLLDEAGYPDPDGDGPKARLTLTYKSSTNPERVEIAQVITQQLGQVGINVELKTLEFGVFFDDVKKGNFQLYTLEWSGITSEDIYYTVFHSTSIPPDGANRGGYSNPEVDKLVEMGRTEPNLEKRKEIYKRVQEIVADDLPYVSLWYRNNVVAFQKRLKDYHVNAIADYTNLISSDLRDNG